jgi:hypothetical protein
MFLTDCVIGEMEKLGQRYTIALRIAKDERFGRLKCDHKGLYADDCIVERVTKHRVYLVATNDWDEGSERPQEFRLSALRMGSTQLKDYQTLYYQFVRCQSISRGGIEEAI